MDYIIGIDIGGTQTRAALVDRAGCIVTSRQSPTRVAEGPHAVIDCIVDYINELREVVPASSNLLGVGLGIAGFVNPKSGVVFASPNLPGWEKVQLRDRVAERTGAKICICNDANAAALGEWHFGGGQGCDNMVYITVSTGIGAGVIMDGRLLSGHLGIGIELGHTVIETRGRKSWEQVASGTAIRAAAAEAMSHHPETLLHRLTTSQHVTAADVSRANQEGDAVAQAIMDHEAELIGIGLVNAIHLFSPEIVLVGGSVITANPFLLDKARRVVYERAMSDIHRLIPIEVAHLGDKVGILGAAALFLTD